MLIPQGQPSSLVPRIQNWGITRFSYLLSDPSVPTKDTCGTAEPFFFFKVIKNFFLISWRLITLQYCSGFCHTLT